MTSLNCEFDFNYVLCGALCGPSLEEGSFYVTFCVRIQSHKTLVFYRRCADRRACQLGCHVYNSEML